MHDTFALRILKQHALNNQLKKFPGLHGMDVAFEKKKYLK